MTYREIEEYITAPQNPLEMVEYYQVAKDRTDNPDNEPVKEEIIKSGNTEEIMDYLKANCDKLSMYAISFLVHRVRSLNAFAEAEKKYEGKKNATTKAVQRPDGGYIINDIALKEKQSSTNGCWSCSYSLMLKSRGVDLSQETIRAYRGDEKKGEKLGDTYALNSDSMSNPSDKTDILMKLVPNTAMKAVNISLNNNHLEPILTRIDGNVAYLGDVAIKAPVRKEIGKILLEQIRKRILDDNSPVGLLVCGHFVTVVGVAGNDDLLLYDSENVTNVPLRRSIDECLSIPMPPGKELISLVSIADIMLKKDDQGKPELSDDYKHFTVNEDGVVGQKPATGVTVIEDTNGNRALQSDVGISIPGYPDIFAENNVYMPIQLDMKLAFPQLSEEKAEEQSSESHNEEPENQAEFEIEYNEPVKPEEIKPEEVKPEEVKPIGVKPEEIKEETEEEIKEETEEEIEEELEEKQEDFVIVENKETVTKNSPENDSKKLFEGEDENNAVSDAILNELRETDIRADEGSNINPANQEEKASQKNENIEVVKTLSRESFENHINTLNNHINAFNRTEGRWHGQSELYNAMKAALMDLTQEKYETLNGVKTYRSFEERLEAAESKVNAYIKHKEDERDTGRTGTRRLSEARAVSEYLKNYRENLHDAVNVIEEEELNREYRTYREEREALNSKINLIAGALTKTLTDGKNIEDIAGIEKRIREDKAFYQMMSSHDSVNGGADSVDYFADMAVNDPERLKELYVNIKLGRPVSEGIYDPYFDINIIKLISDEKDREAAINSTNLKERFEDIRYVAQMADKRAANYIEEVASSEWIKGTDTALAFVSKAVSELNNKKSSLKPDETEKLAELDRKIEQYATVEGREELIATIDTEISRIGKGAKNPKVEKLMEISGYLKKYNEYEKMIEICQYVTRSNPIIEKNVDDPMHNIKSEYVDFLNTHIPELSLDDYVEIAAQENKNTDDVINDTVYGVGMHGERILDDIKNMVETLHKHEEGRKSEKYANLIKAADVLLELSEKNHMYPDIEDKAQTDEYINAINNVVQCARSYINKHQNSKREITIDRRKAANRLFQFVGLEKESIENAITENAAKGKSEYIRRVNLFTDTATAFMKNKLASVEPNRFDRVQAEKDTEIMKLGGMSSISADKAERISANVLEYFRQKHDLTREQLLELTVKGKLDEPKKLTLDNAYQEYVDFCKDNATMYQKKGTFKKLMPSEENKNHLDNMLGFYKKWYEEIAAQNTVEDYFEKKPEEGMMKAIYDHSMTRYAVQNEEQLRNLYKKDYTAYYDDNGSFRKLHNICRKRSGLAEFASKIYDEKANVFTRLAAKYGYDRFISKYKGMSISEVPDREISFNNSTMKLLPAYLKDNLSEKEASRYLEGKAGFDLKHKVNSMIAKYVATKEAVVDRLDNDLANDQAKWEADAKKEKAAAKIYDSYMDYLESVGSDGFDKLYTDNGRNDFIEVIMKSETLNRYINGDIQKDNNDVIAKNLLEEIQKKKLSKEEVQQTNNKQPVKEDKTAKTIKALS